MDIDERKPAAATTAHTADASSSCFETATTTTSTTADHSVKPVLIKHGRTGTSTSTGKTNNNSSGKSKKQSKHLKWDEQAIEEHDLLRGTRMKIDEPNTPYTYYSDSGAESDDSKRQSSQKSPANQKNTISWDSLQNRLDSVANVQQQQAAAAQQMQLQQPYPSSPASSFGGGGGGAEMDNASESGDPLDERKTEMRKLEFQDHRKRHYNEFQMIQKFRHEHPDDEDNDNDDNNNNDAVADDDEDGDADVED
jgi:protein phosphatase inhibitor 2